MNSDQLVSPIPAGGLKAFNGSPTYSEEAIHNAISQRWGKDTPILQYLPQLLTAGQQLPKGMDVLLPIIMALRETQGGKDLIDPNRNANLGKNNIFNIRNETGAFQDYPNTNTAISGNYQQGGPSSGFVGLMQGAQDKNRNIYADFRADPTNMSKFFAHYSPTSDNNGALPEQVNNYNWIRRYILGLPQ